MMTQSETTLPDGATEAPPLLGDRFEAALRYAAAAHRTQARKGTRIPYLSHLLAVASIVLEAGGTEDETIAALLHDVVEDQPLGPGGGRARLNDVREHFGPDVAAMVEALSDWISESADERKDAADYDTRKQQYRARLRTEVTSSAALVSVADKLHNARSMEADLERIGDALWARFSGTKARIYENFDGLIDIYQTRTGDTRIAPLAAQLAQTVERLKRKSPVAG